MRCSAAECLRPVCRCPILSSRKASPSTQNALRYCLETLSIFIISPENRGQKTGDENRDENRKTGENRGQEAVKKLAFGGPERADANHLKCFGLPTSLAFPHFLSPSWSDPTLAGLAGFALGRTISSGCNLDRPR